MSDERVGGNGTAGRLPTPRRPIFGAPMAGGPSAPGLAAAVSDAGGLGSLAGGYLSADRLGEQLDAVRELTASAFGVNLFVPGPDTADGDAVARYAEGLSAEAARYGVSLGTPSYDDDDFEAKLALLVRERPALVTFTFGLPPRTGVEALQAVDVAVGITVTDGDEAALAAALCPDLLIVQGPEAGGHRGTFDDRARLPGTAPGLLAALAEVRLAAPGVPLVAAGGLTDGRDVAAVLAAGAIAAQLGTAFLLAPEAGVSVPQREATADGRFGRPALTRAFSGRTARGLPNRVLREQADAAPSGYPQVNRLTGPLRAAAREAGDPEAMSLWAGQGYRRAVAEPAAAIVTRIADEAAAALRAAADRFGAHG